jgi:hypothetical protein
MTAPKRKTPKETPEEAILRATEARRLARIEGARRLPPDKRRPQPRAEEKPNYTVRTPDGATWDERGRPVWQWPTWHLSSGGMSSAPNKRTARTRNR